MEKITHENWPESWQDVPSFTEISEDVYTDMLNVLPPVHLRQSPYCGFQMGQPLDYAEDENGRWRARFLTFVHVGGRCFYAGINFGGECVQRMLESEPTHMRGQD